MRQSIQYVIDTACQSYVEGWALSRSGRCTIEVVVDGRAVGNAVTGISRADVAAAMPHVSGSAESGFIYAFNERDLSDANRDASVWLRITSDGTVVETERIEIPVPSHTDAPPLPRSCFPAAITEAVIGRSPELATRDLTSTHGAFAALDVLEHLLARGPRPVRGVHRYLNYLRTVSNSAVFAQRYFPKANVHMTGDKDSTGMLTNPVEMLTIANHLYVLADRGVPGAVLEFGCYKGYSTSVLSTACHQLGRHLHVFDSFSGLPLTESVVYRPGEFAGDLEEVKRNVAEFGRPDVVTLNPGFFSESLPAWQPMPVMCLWMDVDLEQSAIDALKVFPNLDRRGALFSHECRPESFSDGRPVPHRGPDDVVGPITDAFSSTGRQPVGMFLSGHTGAFWDAHDGTPVLHPEPFARLLALATR